MEPKTVLIADENESVRRCIRRVLSQDESLKLRWEADNGLEALKLARQNQPDLVVLDASLPRMDGLEATRCLRQGSRRVHILVTGIYEEMRTEALQAGADAFVVKGSGCEAIRAAVIEALNGPAPV